jgi:hypothetical protein
MAIRVGSLAGIVLVFLASDLFHPYSVPAADTRSLSMLLLLLMMTLIRCPCSYTAVYD